MLEMYLIQLIFRLSSTLIKEGYLPIDRSGDHIYQARERFFVRVCTREKGQMCSARSRVGMPGIEVVWYGADE